MKNNAITIKVKVIEWKAEKVEYICEVDEDIYKKHRKYVIGDIDSLGDMSNSGGDAMGMYCNDISRKVIEDKIDFNSEVISWRVL